MIGDIEPDDVFDAEGTPEPEQVARRLHELRAYLDALTGGDRVERFEQLEPAARQLAVEVGAVIVRWLVEHEPDDAEGTARNLHEVRRYWSGGALAPWDELPPDERAVGVEVIGSVVDWLNREGSI